MVCNFPSVKAFEDYELRQLRFYHGTLNIWKHILESDSLFHPSFPFSSSPFFYKFTGLQYPVMISDLIEVNTIRKH